MNPAAGTALADVVLAARMCAIDPALGGVMLRGSGIAQEQAVAAMAAALPDGAPVRRLPVAIDLGQLDGGIDLAAALAGRGVGYAAGLLERVAGGLLVAPMAERMAPPIAARLAHELDMRAAFTVAALDEGGAEESVPDSLADRLAFRIDLTPGSASGQEPVAGDDRPVELEDAMTALAGVAAALGIASARADLLALRAARASAACEDRDGLIEADLARAVRLVLAPRATRQPVAAEPDEAPPPPPEGEGEAEGTDRTDSSDGVADRVLAAARAAIDPALLAALGSGLRGRGNGRRAKGAGERRRSRNRGRRVGVRQGEPRAGLRLALAETLRAAAPWQTLRGRTDRLVVRRSDLRVFRFEARAETVTIFAVDASGSTALARLAETKGAIELLLAQAYVQRAEVALIAFRHTGAELLLPPTRSLTRARRALADLPGGGGTPLASGIEAARAAAAGVRAKGRTPFVVLLSDGRGNIAADGSAGRIAAERDALAAARALAADGVAAVFIDTSPRARPEGARLAAAMDARYLPLPYADAARVEAAVSALAPRRR